MNRYDYVVVNDEVEACVERLRAIVVAERAKVRAMRQTAEQIIATFRSQTSGIGSQKSESVVSDFCPPTSVL